MLDLQPASGSDRLAGAPAYDVVVIGGSAGLSLIQSEEEVELQCIVEALRKHGNNRLRAAAELGISRMALYKKLHKYGLMDNGAQG